MPPTVSVCHVDSLGEQIQRAFPGASVAKALNTLTAALMVDPRSLDDGEHDLFICGGDAAAKHQVADWLEEWLGWRHVLDVDGISAPHRTELVLPLRLCLWGAHGTPLFNFSIVR